MSNLLSAGFDRLFKNRLFQSVIIIMFAFGCCAGLNVLSDLNSGLPADLSNALFSYSIFGGCVTAVLSSMFSGTEYSDGTIRNKIIAGFSRVDIYLSNLIINIVSGAIAVVTYVVPYVVICLLTVGKSAVSLNALITSALLSILSLMAFSAIFNAVTMLITKKAAAAVACLLLYVGLFMFGMTTYNRIQEPEFYPGYQMFIDGEAVEPEPIPNPDYLTGTKLEVFKWLEDINPGAQSVQIFLMEVARPVRSACCAGAVMVIFTLAGAVIFTKKDLK